MDRMKITAATHPKLVELLKRVYPEYHGRKFAVEFRRRYRVWDFWDGGSRTYTTFMDLRSGALIGSEAIPTAMRQHQGNWFNLPITDDFDLPDYVAVVEHRISCGKDVGLRLILHPDAGQVPGAAALTGIEPYSRALPTVTGENT